MNCNTTHYRANSSSVPGDPTLYTTVPNVKGREALLEAVKTVWASIWNFEAFEARRAAGMAHLSARMGVLVQTGIAAESAGVLITRNPFNPDDRRSVFINAKKGLGIRVVDGHKVPEQLLFNPHSGATRILSLSGETTALAPAARGGVEEVAITAPTPRVLTEARVIELVRAAQEIERKLAVGTVDIEWAVADGHVWILQARPFVD